MDKYSVIDYRFTSNSLYVSLKINPLIILCSTSEVYGSVKKKDVPITEDQKISPSNPYAVSKTFQDLLVIDVRGYHRVILSLLFCCL